jgi:hypothetical protein
MSQTVRVRTGILRRDFGVLYKDASIRSLYLSLLKRFTALVCGVQRLSCSEISIYFETLGKLKGLEIPIFFLFCFPNPWHTAAIWLPTE